LLVTLLLATAGRLPADKVYLRSSSQAAAIEGQAEEAIVGMVLSEEDGQVTIRVEGGTLVLAKAQIARIERGGLTEAQLEEREATMREALAAADQQRQQQLGAWAEAAARRAEAPEPQAIEVSVDFQGLLPAQVFRFYEPIIGRIDMEGLGRAIEDYLRAELRRLREADRR